MFHLQHNIVSILYSIKGLIESHLAQVEEGRFALVPDRLDHAETILKKAYLQSTEALKITKRLGHVLKKETVGPREKPPTVILSAWRNVLEMLKKEFDLDSCEILERIPENFPAVLCKKEDLEEIFFHLVKNALQAMQSKGRVILRAQLAYSLKEEPFAAVTLSDTGPGISENELPNLFKPFFTTKSEGEGNGLGLYLAGALVRKNGGRINAASFSGFGTTFTLEFPAVRMKAGIPLDSF